MGTFYNTVSFFQEKKKAQVDYEQDLSNKVKQIQIRKSIAEKSKALDPSHAVKAATQQKLREKMLVIK